MSQPICMLFAFFSKISNHKLGYLQTLYTMLTFVFFFSELFLDNVFSQLEEDGPRVCRLASTSRVLEKLVQDASDRNVLLLFKTFSLDWSILLSDRFASHVLQKLISQVPRCLKNFDDSEDDSDDAAIFSCFLDLTNYLKENFDSVKTDTYASHIVRVVLQVLGGVNIGEQVIRSRLSRHQVSKGNCVYLILKCLEVSFNPKGQVSYCHH